MTEFVASNGVSIRGRKAEGWTPLEWNLPTDDRVWRLVGESTERVGMARGFSLDSRLADAFREFFLAERDAELGRWRSKEHPGIYVQPFDHTTDVVAVLKEEGGLAYGQYSRSDVLNGPSLDPMRTAAREFFAAHPEPKPWHNAQHGEVWALTIHLMGEQPYQVVRTEESGFRFFLIADQEGFRPGLFPNEEQIIAGRRIWPEA